jgi:hypothetical protein
MTRRPKKTRRTKNPARPARAAPKPSRKAKSRTSNKPEPLDDFIAAGTHALDLKIDKAWLPAVRGHLEVTLRHGALVAAFAMPDDAEPAPIFEA